MIWWSRWAASNNPQISCLILFGFYLNFAIWISLFGFDGRVQHLIIFRFHAWSRLKSTEPASKVTEYLMLSILTTVHYYALNCFLQHSSSSLKSQNICISVFLNISCYQSWQQSISMHIIASIAKVWSIFLAVLLSHSTFLQDPFESVSFSCCWIKVDENRWRWMKFDEMDKQGWNGWVKKLLASDEMKKISFHH